jgi:hypothetical protein
MSHGAGAVIVDRAILRGAPIRAVSYLQPEHEWDSGFALLSGPPDSAAETALVCLQCIIDDHPEIAHGLDQARQHGEAIIDNAGGSATTTRIRPDTV